MCIFPRAYLCTMCAWFPQKPKASHLLELELQTAVNVKTPK